MAKVINDNGLFEQLEAVRDTGEANMLDRRGVQQVANELGLSELIIFVEDAERKEYLEFIKAI